VCGLSLFINNGRYGILFENSLFRLVLFIIKQATIFMKAILIIPICAVLLSGCASAVKRHELAQGHLNKTVDCDVAHTDIVELESHKTSTREKLANGVASILPTSILLNVLLGEFTSRAAIATGAFDAKVDQKIFNIRSNCMLKEDDRKVMLVKQ
jgi:uncharacterized protein YceK